MAIKRPKKAAAKKADDGVTAETIDETPTDLSVVIDPATNELVPRDAGDIELELVLVLLAVGELALFVKVF